MKGIPRDARETYLSSDGEPIAFCPKEGFGLTDLFRIEFYQLNRSRMQELLARAALKGDHVAICIDVDDPTWTWLVDALMPGFDWDAIRDRGERPVARGVVWRAPVEETIRKCYPAALPLPEREMIVVFAAGGVSIFGKESGV